MDAGHVFDQEMLLKSILPLVGEATFLEVQQDISPLYPPHISPISPPYLPYVSP